MKGRTGLKSLTLAGFFPAQDYPFAMMALSPYTYIAELEAMRTGGSLKAPEKVTIRKIRASHDFQVIVAVLFSLLMKHSSKLKLSIFNFEGRISWQCSLRQQSPGK